MKKKDLGTEWEFTFLDQYQLKIAKLGDEFLNGEKKKRQADRSYLQAVLDKPQEVEREMKCMLTLIQRLKSELGKPTLTANGAHIRVDKVVELFGGAGLVSSIIQKELNPAFHVMWDIDTECVQCLQTQFADVTGMLVTKGDAYKLSLPEITPESVLFCDFNSFTIHGLMKGNTEGKFLDEAFAKKPLAVEFTDSAVNKLHLHTQRYSQLLGGPAGNIAEYLNSYRHLGYERWGYSLVEAAFHHGASYTLWLPGQHLFHQITKAA